MTTQPIAKYFTPITPENEQIPDPDAVNDVAVAVVLEPAAVALNALTSNIASTECAPAKTDTAKRSRSEGSTDDDTPFLKKVIRDPMDVTLELPEDAPYWVPALFKKMDQLVDYVHSITEKHDTFKAVFEQKIIETTEKFETICTENNNEIADLKKSVEFISDAYDDQKKQNETLIKRIETLENHQETIKQKCREYEQDLSEQAVLIDDLEQYSRRNCLLIHGVPETKGEETDTIAIDTFETQLKIKLKSRDLDRTHRIGAPKKGKIRPIIVKFATYNKRRSVFKNKKLCKGSKIALTESLTYMKVRLLNAAKKRFGKENVWTSDGEVLTKVGEQIVNVKKLM